MVEQGHLVKQIKNIGIENQNLKTSRKTILFGHVKYS